MQTPARGKQLGVLTYWVAALLALTAVIDLLGVVSLLIERSLVLDSLAGRPVSIDEAIASDHRVEAVGGWTLIALLVTGVLWCIWQHRAHSNLRAFGRNGLRYTPGWAVGWWFIPIANLWKPFQTVRELWKASHGGGWRTIATWSLLGWWWGTWLAGSLNVQFGANTRVGILFGSSATLDQVSVADAISEDRWRVVWLGFRVVAAVLAIVIVRSVERLQRAAEAAGGDAAVVAMPAAPVAVEADAGALPPPPPTAPTVEDSMTSSERTLILGVVIGVVALSIAGQVWVGRDHGGSGSVAPPVGTPSALPSGEGTTYAQHGVQFTYPSDWTEGPTSTSGSVGSPPEWTDGFSPPAATSYDIVIVSAYALNGDAGSLDTSRQQQLVKNLTNSLLSSLGGKLTADVAPIAIGSEQGYHSLMSLTLQGVAIAVDFNVLFHGSQEYTIVCQSTASTTAAVAEGCGAIRDTFQVTG